VTRLPLTRPARTRGRGFARHRRSLDELYVFRSKEEAESFMEPVDVEPDERGYDSEGRLLHVVVRGRPELL